MLVLPLGFCKYCCSGHGWLNFSLRSSFQFLWIYAQKWNHSLILFNFMNSFYKIFPDIFTILQSHKQHVSVLIVPISPHPCQSLHFWSGGIVPVLTTVKWYFTVVLICVFLMIDDDVHLFICLLVICMYPLKNYLFKSFTHFCLLC